MTIEDVLHGRARWHVEHAESLSLAVHRLDNGVFDAVITDWPYSSGGQFRGDRTQATGDKYTLGKTKIVRPDFAGDTRDQRSYELWGALVAGECLRASKLGAPGCFFTDWRQIAATIDAIQAGGWIYRGIVPWDKTEGCRPQMGRFAAQCEYVVWGSNGPMSEERGVGCLPGITRAFPDPRKKYHQTGKPIETMLDVVRICEPGGVVLDLFAGSGSTGVACLREGRRFVGVEVTEEYYLLARERREAEERGLDLEAAREGQTSLFDGAA